MAAPRCFDEDDGFVEVVAHGITELEFHAGFAFVAVADGEAAVPFEELDVDIIADDPFAVFAQMGFYAAILWFPFPIGSLNYLKVRVCPLETRRTTANVAGDRQHSQAEEQ